MNTYKITRIAAFALLVLFICPFASESSFAAEYFLDWYFVEANNNYGPGDKLASVKKPSAVLYSDEFMNSPARELRRYERVILEACGYRMGKPYIYKVKYYDTSDATVRQLKESDGVLPVLDAANINWEKYQIIENTEVVSGYIYADAVEPHVFTDSEEWGRRVVGIGLSRQGIHALYNQQLRYNYFFADCSSFTWWTLKESGIRLPSDDTTASGITGRFLGKPDSVIYSKQETIILLSPDLDGLRTSGGISYTGVGDHLNGEYTAGLLAKAVNRERSRDVYTMYNYSSSLGEAYSDSRVTKKYTVKQGSLEIDPDSINGFYYTDGGGLSDRPAYPFVFSETDNFYEAFENIAVGDVISFIDGVTETVGFTFAYSYISVCETFDYCTRIGVAVYNCIEGCNGSHVVSGGRTEEQREFRDTYTFESFTQDTEQLAGNPYRITHIGIYAGDGMSIDNTGGMLTGNLLHCTSGEDSRGRAGVRLDDLGDSVKNIFLIGRPSAFVP